MLAQTVCYDDLQSDCIFQNIFCFSCLEYTYRNCFSCIELDLNIERILYKNLLVFRCLNTGIYVQDGYLSSDWY